MINNLKDLRSVLKLCRQYGVTEINVGTVAIKLGELPNASEVSEVSYPSEEDLSGPYANFPQEAMSPERLQYYAMGGTPEADPFKDENTE